MNKNFFPVFAILILAGAALACSLPGMTEPGGQRTSGDSSGPAPVTVEPTVELNGPAATGAQSAGGILGSYRGTNAVVSFLLPVGIANGSNNETIAKVGEQDGAAWDAAPEHVKITLLGYPLQDKFLLPTIYVYPAQEYEAVSNGAVESLKRLRALTSGAGMGIDNQSVPYVPFFNAAQMFEAQALLLKFQNGSGIRMLTQYAQAYNPVNNFELIYHFEGLTGDGKYYIVAILPVSAPFLAADISPDSPVPPEGVPFSMDDPQGYYDAIASKLNSTAPEAFTPSLTTLDALIQSLSVVAP